MKFALINGVKTEAAKGLTGTCQCCGGVVIAKCGQFKIHHWAHKSLKQCDPWWENETDWHRQWKSYFPVSNQEVIFISPTGEKHIADIYLPDKKCVIEVQSYQIKPEEMKSREDFYNVMIWVVNGCKNEFDKYYFHLSVHEAHTNDKLLRKINWVGRSKLIARWSNTTKHVYFDFGESVLWHLIEFDTKSKQGLVKAYYKQNFIKFFGGSL